jgi:hypothetical protein
MTTTSGSATSGPASCRVDAVEVGHADVGLGHVSSAVRTSRIEDAVYDQRRVEDAVLALMHLNAHRDKFGWRAWKSFPWEATDGLHERGLIDDPRSKAKSVPLTDEGARLAEQLFAELFGVEEPGSS